jgi:putative toxin-antitoxin system antitoxin component (TIGR02293 family)
MTAKEHKFYFGIFLGIETSYSLSVIEAIKKGLPFQSLEKMSRKADFPLDVLARSIGISPRTLNRRKKENKLSSFESDRLVSISRLLALAVELFEDNNIKAFQWFQRSNRGLGGYTLLEMAATETGSREVENLIGRLEYGVF